MSEKPAVDPILDVLLFIFGVIGAFAFGEWQDSHWAFVVALAVFVWVSIIFDWFATHWSDQR